MFGWKCRMSYRNIVTAGLVAALWSLGCQGSESSETSTVATRAEGASGSQALERQAVVGHWRSRNDSRATVTYNSAGNMRTNAHGLICIGTYEVTNGELRFSFNEGQGNCINLPGIVGELLDDGEILRFNGNLIYRRVDAEDELF